MPSVPNVHFTMIVVAAGMALGAFIGHLFRPEDKLAEYIVTACMGALFGKFSNGFGKSPSEFITGHAPEPSVVGANADDEDQANARRADS